MKKYSLSLTICLLLCIAAHAQSLLSKNFRFNGFRLFLTGMATDGADNLVFIGNIQAREHDSTLRDTMMNRIFCHNIIGNYDDQGIVIITDNRFRIKQVESFGFDYPSRVGYDKKAKQFFIAGRYDNYKASSYEKDNFLFIATYGPKDNEWHYGSTLLGNYFTIQDIVAGKDTYMASIVADTIVGKEKLHIPVIVELSRTITRNDKGYPIHKLSSFVYAPVPPINYIELTDLQQRDGGYCLAISQYDNGYGIKNISLFDYHHTAFTDLQFFPFDSRMYLYNFKYCADSSLFFCYNSYLSDKYFDLCKTDKYYRQKWKIRVTSGDYARFTHNILEMPAGELVVPLVNAEKEWTFNIYSANGALLKKVKTSITSKTYIPALKSTGANTFISLFSSSEIEHPATVQLYNIN